MKVKTNVPQIFVIPAKAGTNDKPIAGTANFGAFETFLLRSVIGVLFAHIIFGLLSWVPACAGMTPEA